ncbi:hypothetical protein BST81_15135 [Leptolyngbya sp. 'hensonii']|uniref:type IV pilus secretin family protein n=1 Tax=Leptolyngbya sp. 'hensonii' TaxID=1922337 RepID=UPI00094F9942|nr:type IV pilus secretin family protein [Leptolyngbya sp. 'hensonii']OLP17654.1 hypothetical protein BST81_15135 [Leptolyngbya sp. 'hensonii']
MRQILGLGSIALSGVVMLAAARPAWADATQVTAVRTNVSAAGMQVLLETQGGDRPQVFSTKRGKVWMADVINTQLRLPATVAFRQDNPAPGIAAVEVFPLDTNSVRVRITGQNSPPAGQMIRTDRGLVISLAALPVTSQSAPGTGAPGTVAQTPNSTPPAPVGAPGPNPANPVAPNPALSPPFLPRAVAPPIGDIAVSAVDIAATDIDLGTAERVPRLVLRDAPVREVLSLLARAAGLNVAFSEASVGAAPGAPPAAGAAPATATTGPTISLDIENESVQDVFNYVLRLSGLQASKSGRTIFIGRSLPAEARNLILRTLRLNQLKASLPETNMVSTSNSSSSLTTAGGGQGGATTNSSLGRSSNYSQSLPVRGAMQILVGLGADSAGGGAVAPTASTTADLPLRGLTVTADNRTNSITLIGTPRVVDIATSYLTQLDVRKRQVAVNVKIVDVNLLNTDSFTSSFSFGVADTFVNVANGQATVNFGQFRPPNQAETRGSLLGQPVINNPFSSANTFLNFNSPQSLPLGQGIDTIFNGALINSQAINSTVFPATTRVGSDPFTAGISQFSPGTRDQSVTTITTDAGGNQVATTSFNRGTLPTVTQQLPSLFQFPQAFLLNLQAQITSGNAKVLTDPTLIVQEGSQSQVNLTSQVFSGFREERRTEGNLTTTSILPGSPIDVGVILNIAVDQIDDNGFVTLSVSPEVSAPGQTITDPNRNNLVIQQLVNRRRLETGIIRLRDGQTLILTGVIQEGDRVVTTKTPILGDLPLIGSLFRSTSKENTRSEVVVLVTPQIMDDSQQSGAGYSYTPSPDVRQILEQRNPGNR